MGSMPFLKQLLKKMSAKEGAMMQRMPKSLSAQGACSRDDPHPKFSPATKMAAERYAAWREPKQTAISRWNHNTSSTLACR